MLNNNQSTPGSIKTISKSVDTKLSPVEIFHGLSQHYGLTNSMLLESSEIESKKSVKSLLMLKAALRIECNEHQVGIKALTANGENALSHISSVLDKKYDAQSPEINDNTIKLERSANSLTISYIQNNASVDEDTRLKQATTIDCLRTIKNAFTTENNSEYSLFLTGMFAYDLIASFEKLPALATGKNTCPDYVFYLAESLLVLDHQKNHQRLYCNHFSGEKSEQTYFELARFFEKFEQQLSTITTEQKKQSLSASSLNTALTPVRDIQVDISREQYKNTVTQLKENIIQGDIFQVVPSRSFSLNCQSPIDSYRELKLSNPSPYMFYMQDEDFSLFGASPESSLKYTKSSNEVELYPIAGTRARGRDRNQNIDLDLDARLEAELKQDNKETAEHMMLVDLARNDIAKISIAGTTHVPRLLEVDRYSQVMHLVSCVRGHLRKDLDALHAYQACMNMGTLTGAPKIKATELIRKVEGQRRGSYGGAVGYLNGNGDMDTCIVIRSAFYKDGTAYIQAGAGVVYDSVPELEATETESKAAAVINAIQTANLRLKETAS